MAKLNIIDALRAKLDEEPFKDKVAAAELSEDYTARMREETRVAYENMTKGRRLGLLEAMELLGCDSGEESEAHHARMHRATCTDEDCPVCRTTH